jgi:dinuclear metal center YbgI/SA1388 family protein
MITVANFVGFLEQLAPLSLAASWDNVGLLLGDPADEVREAMTCLTITPPVVDEAIEAGVQLIVTHHPVLFKGAKKLSTATTDGRLVLPLAKAGIAVYSPHTAFDNAAGGINDQLAMSLGLGDVRPLRPAPTPQVKIVVFTPDADLAKVSDALFSAGAGIIGQYSQCGFRLAGTGTFFASDLANPTIGAKGTREEVAEWRLEVVCPRSRIDDAVRAMRQAHSYEEPAFDIVPLLDRPSGVGEGRIGRLASALPLRRLASMLRESSRSDCVQAVGDPERLIGNVALACGAAGEFLDDAIARQADLFITGEARFHDCLRAEAAGIALLLPGHYATERPAVEALADMLRERFPSVECWASRRERDPLQTIG